MVLSMATTPSIKVTKDFTFRSVDRKFTNRYHFDGDVPADNTKWGTFCDNVVAAEKAIFKTTVGQILQVDGYAAGSEVPVFTKTYTTAYTGAFALWEEVPGDCAALIRYSTTARTSKNHPVYLFNYYHAVGKDQGGSPDIMNTAQRAAMSTYAAAWIAGFSDGSVTHHRAGPNGATATGSLVEQFITHRDLPR